MEATGGLEKLPFGLLWEAGLACALVNPRQVRRFAEAMGFLEKTDDIDAGVIVRFAQAKDLVGQVPATPSQDRLRALVVRLRQLTELKVAQSNQRRLLTDPDAQASIDEILALIRRQVRGFETAIAELLGADPVWRAGRPYTYVAQSWDRAGFTIISTKDYQFKKLFSWTIENPELHGGTGGMDGKYFKLKGKYYYVQSLQFGQSGPDADVGAVVADVTLLPDTSKVKVFARIREKEYLGANP